MRQRLLASLLAATTLPLLGAAAGDGCGALNSRSPAPDIGGTWDITYDDTLDVEITIGGNVYQETVGSQGGSVTINHNGEPFTFDLDCARTDVICPSEAWPESVQLEQRNDNFPHRMWASLLKQDCDGELIAPDDRTCTDDSLNPDCEDVCEGRIGVKRTDRFGVINEAGSRFDLFLGAGVASNGFNCLLLGTSQARASLETSGDESEGDWLVERMTGGKVITAYAGGCLWAGDPNGDGNADALVLGAKVKFTTGFSGERQ